MKVGYARVSTKDQRLSLQLDALKREGCAAIYKEKRSAVAAERPALDKALRVLRQGDTLVVWRLDRLGRSLQDLIAILQLLDGRGVHFHSVADRIDTTSPMGRLVFHIAGAMAEFEHALISERTKAGMQSARGKGKCLGRPASMSPEQIEYAIHLSQIERMSLKAIASRINVGKTTVWRAIHFA